MILMGIGWVVVEVLWFELKSDGFVLKPGDSDGNPVVFFRTSPPHFQWGQTKWDGARVIDIPWYGITPGDPEAFELLRVEHTSPLLFRGAFIRGETHPQEGCSGSSSDYRQML